MEFTEDDTRAAKEAEECEYTFGLALYYDKPWKIHDGAVLTLEVERVQSKKRKLNEGDRLVPSRKCQA